MEAKSILHVVGVECSPEMDAEFNIWYDETHIPYLLKLKILTRVSRYKMVGAARTGAYEAGGVMDTGKEYPRYLTIYEFGSLEDFKRYDTSPELTAGREDVIREMKEVDGKMVWRVQYELMKTWEG